MIREYNKIKPRIVADSFIADSAEVIGRVSVDAFVSIWYNATVRGDVNEILIGSYSNVQDNAVLHVAGDHRCVLGSHVTIGHSAIIHGCEIGDNTLVGLGAKILDGAVIGANSLVAAGALVLSGASFPPGSLIMGAPAKVKKALTDNEIESQRRHAEKYWQEALRHKGIF